MNTSRTHTNNDATPPYTGGTLDKLSYICLEDLSSGASLNQATLKPALSTDHCPTKSHEFPCADHGGPWSSIDAAVS
jgi:hypothetical protein